MSIRTTAGELKRALSRVMVVIDDWQHLDALRSVRIDSISVTATDLDVQVMADLATEGPAAPLLVDARRLMQLLELVHSDARVELRETDGEPPKKRISVTVGDARFSFPFLSVESFPLFPVLDVEPIRLGKEFQRALLQCAPFMSDEATRYYLHGVFLDDDKLVATDGWQMAYHPAGLKTGLHLILHKTMVKALLCLSRPLWMSFDAHRKLVLMRTEKATVIAKPIDGKFPDWRKVADKALGFRFEAAFRRRELHKALEVAGRQSDAYQSVLLAVGEDRVAAVGYSYEGVTSAIPIHVDGHNALPHTDHGRIFCTQVNSGFACSILNLLRNSENVILRFQGLNTGGSITFHGRRDMGGLILMSQGKKGVDKWPEAARRLLDDVREAQA